MVVMKPLMVLTVQPMLPEKASNGPLSKIWCYWVDELNMEHTTLLAETRRANRFVVKLMSIVMNISHLILHVVEFLAGIITTT